MTTMRLPPSITLLSFVVIFLLEAGALCQIFRSCRIWVGLGPDNVLSVFCELKMPFLSLSSVNLDLDSSPLPAGPSWNRQSFH